MKGSSSTKKFMFTILLCAILGGLAALVLLRMDGPRFATWLSQRLIIASPWLLTASVIICLAIAIVLVSRAKRHLQRPDWENDDDFARIDHELAIAMIVLNYLYIAAFLFFGIFIAGSYAGHDAADIPQLAMFVFALGVFVIGAFIGIYVQTQAIALTKKLYPDKKGDPLSNDFTQDWLDSCDEAEQYIIYRSAYQAYQRTQKCLIFGWLAAVFGAMFFATGLLPIVLVTVLWGIQTMTYYHAEQKFSKTDLRS